MSRSGRIVLALLAGLVGGIALAGGGVPASAPPLVALGLVGDLWLNALRMTVLPFSPMFTFPAPEVPRSPMPAAVPAPPPRSTMPAAPADTAPATGPRPATRSPSIPP